MVEVTQSARDAAVALVKADKTIPSSPYSRREFLEGIASGQFDGFHIVQAIAAAEQRGAERQRERDAKVAERLGDEWKPRDGKWGVVRKDEAYGIAQAIRQEPTT